MTKTMISKLEWKTLVLALMIYPLFSVNPIYAGGEFCDTRKTTLTTAVGHLNFLNLLIKNPDKIENKQTKEKRTRLIERKERFEFNLYKSINLYEKDCGEVDWYYDNKKNLILKFN